MSNLTEAKNAFIAAVRDYLSEFEGGAEHLVQNAEERMASFVSDIENTTRGWAKKVEHVAEEIVEEVREEVREIIGDEPASDDSHAGVAEPTSEGTSAQTADVPAAADGGNPGTPAA